MKQENKDILTYETILRDIARKKKGLFSLSRSFPAYLLLIVMLALSFFIYYSFEQQLKNERRIAFEKAVNSVLTRFQIGYNSHLQIATSIRGLYDNLVQVVRDYLLLYASVPTKTFKSILGFMSVQKVPRNRLTEFVYYVQGQGYYDYKVYPAVDKSVYYPIEFIIPEDANKKYRGLDVSTVEGLNGWFQYAIENGEPTATRVFNFRGGDTLSMFLISPIYDRAFTIINNRQRREAFKTAVLMEINIPLFFKQSLGAGVPSDTSIIFYCYQKDNDILETRLFNSSNIGLLQQGFKPLLSQTVEFKFLDKPIYIYFATTPDFGGTFQKYLPLIALGVSVLLSFVFFGFVISITTSRARAIDLAERMTRSQRRILESTKDIIAVLSFDGTWKTMNSASKVLLGYEPVELIGNKIDILFMNSKDLRDFYSSLEDVTQEYTRKVDYQMKTKNGQQRWINWSFTISPNDNYIYAIGRDITLEKRAEIEERIKAKQTMLAEQISREASEFKSYFMTKFSHQLRNALTTIAGYHQILFEKKYDNEEELKTYLELAMNETQELLSSSSDLFDVADFRPEGSKILSTLNVANVINEALVSFQKRNPNKDIKLIFDENGRYATVASNREEMRNAFEKLFLALSNGYDSIEAQVQINESKVEDIVEIQILVVPNEKFEKMIHLYNENLTNLIEVIRYDVDDILLNLAFSASMFRILNGRVKFESLGSDGNLITIVLPKSQ